MSRSSICLVPFVLFSLGCCHVCGCASSGLSLRTLTALCSEMNMNERSPHACVRHRNELVERSISSTVRVHVDEEAFLGSSFVGTGVVIGDGSYALTARHVIRHDGRISVAPRSTSFTSVERVSVIEQSSVPVIVVRSSEEKDVALLARKDGGKFSHPARIVPRGQRAIIGQHLWHFGQSTGIAHGMVTRIGVSGEDKDRIVKVNDMSVFGANADVGDSGGPVMTDDGLLAGIALMMSEDMKFTYFVPIHDVLDALGVSYLSAPPQ